MIQLICSLKSGVVRYRCNSNDLTEAFQMDCLTGSEIETTDTQKRYVYDSATDKWNVVINKSTSDITSISDNFIDSLF